MTTAAQIALVASVLIVAAGVLGVALANARNTQRGQTESLYQRENEALGKALARQEQENARLLAKVESLSQSNLVLQETVSGTAAVRELATSVADDEQRRREEHQTIMVLLKDVIAELRQARGAIGR